MSALRPTTALTLRSAAKFARDYQSPCMMSSEASKVRVLAQKTRLNASSQQGLLTEGKIMSDADCPGLSAHQVRKYQEDGYLILPGFVSPEELDGLQTRMEELIAGFNPKDISIFSTKKQNQKIDNYFLQSGACFSPAVRREP